MKVSYKSKTQKLLHFSLHNEDWEWIGHWTCLKAKIERGLGTERARLGSFRGFNTERARLGTFRGLCTERARLGTFRGFGTERARLGTLNQNFEIFFKMKFWMKIKKSYWIWWFCKLGVDFQKTVLNMRILKKKIWTPNFTKLLNP